MAQRFLNQAFRIAIAHSQPQSRTDSIARALSSRLHDLPRGPPVCISPGLCVHGRAMLHSHSLRDVGSLEALLCHDLQRQ
eukprot:5137654-Lingulodinium_polyedra.AAC.1